MTVFMHPRLDEGTVLPIVTPVLTVHATYASGDYVGTSGTPMTFANCVVPGGYGWLQGARMISYTVTTTPMHLWLFHTTITPPADSAAWTITDAEALTCIGVIPFTTFYSSALNTVSFAAPDAPCRFRSITGSLFGAMVTQGTQTYADGDLSIILSIYQE